MQGQAAIRIAAIIACGALFATPAAADTPPMTHDGYLILRAGQTALIHLDPDSKIVFDQGWPSQTDADKPSDAAPDHLLLSFTTGGPGATLVVKSGYATAFNYHARLRRGSAVRPTSVCPLLARGAGFESWQESIDGVEVGDFTAASINALRCQ